MASRVSTLFWSQLILIVDQVLSFYTYKKQFVQSDGVNISLLEEDVGNSSETFTFLAIWVLKQGHASSCYRPTNRSMYVLLLLLRGDIESCPGPSEIYADKFHSLQDLFDRYVNIDIMTLSETHIIDGQYDDVGPLYQIPGYYFLKRNRQCGKGGGLAMFIKNEIKWERRHDLENDDVESIWIEVSVKNAKIFLLAVYYRPPMGSSYLPANFNNILGNSLQESARESKEIIIIGDFNANYLNQNDHKELKAILRLYGFSQVIKQATRITKHSSTLIDLILTNNEAVISMRRVFSFSLSDHDMVGCIRKLHNVSFSPKIINCRNYSLYNPEAIEEDFKSVNWSSVYKICDVNQALKCFNGIVKSIFDICTSYR